MRCKWWETSENLLSSHHFYLKLLNRLHSPSGMFMKCDFLLGWDFWSEISITNTKSKSNTSYLQITLIEGQNSAWLWRKALEGILPLQNSCFSNKFTLVLNGNLHRQNCRYWSDIKFFGKLILKIPKKIMIWTEKLDHQIVGRL